MKRSQLDVVRLRRQPPLVIGLLVYGTLVIGSGAGPQRATAPHREGWLRD